MDFIKENIKKNSYVLGAILALITPFILLFVFYFSILLITSLFNVRSLEIERLYLLSLSANLLLLRYYLVSIKQMKTGKSILAITFLFVLLFFIIHGSR